MALKRMVVPICLASWMFALPPAQGVMSPDASCKQAKAKAAGKTATDVLKAYMRNEKQPDEVRLAADISRSEARFAEALLRAEARGFCSTVNDREAIEDQVEAFVSRVLGVISPVCGDGLRAPGEECDLEDDEACPGQCRPNCTCTSPVCGDGLRAPGEECDLEDDEACPGQCRANCTCAPCDISSEWPMCGGSCPASETCADIGFGCGCVPAATTPCGSSFPACDGDCPTGQTCAGNAFFGCVCAPAEYPACGAVEAPACDGACRPGLFCVANLGSCSCIPGGAERPCGSVEGAPACLGGCPSDAPICRDAGGACTCTGYPSKAFMDAVGSGPEPSRSHL